MLICEVAGTGVVIIHVRWQGRGAERYYVIMWGGRDGELRDIMLLCEVAGTGSWGILCYYVRWQGRGAERYYVIMWGGRDRYLSSLSGEQAGMVGSLQDKWSSYYLALWGLCVKEAVGCVCFLQYIRLPSIAEQHKTPSSLKINVWWM